MRKLKKFYGINVKKNIFFKLYEKCILHKIDLN